MKLINMIKIMSAFLVFLRIRCLLCFGLLFTLSAIDDGPLASGASEDRCSKMLQKFSSGSSSSVEGSEKFSGEVTRGNLLHLLGSDSKGQREAAAKMYLELSFSDEESDNDFAFGFMQLLGGREMKAFEEVLSDSSNSFFRARSASLLGLVGDTASVKALVNSLKTERDSFVRQKIVTALGEFDSSEVRSVLDGILNNDKNEAVRRAAEIALNEIQTHKAQKAYMKWLGEKQLGYTKPEDWYGLTGEMIRANSGFRLLQKFRGSPSEMVMALVEAPEGGWRPWGFSKVSKGFWDIEANQKAYMEWLGKELGFSKPEDWYGLTHKLIHENAGGGLLQKFNGSVSEMILALEEAPEGGWLPWGFSRVSDGFWDIEENQKKYMKWLGEKLGYTEAEDWYGLTHKLIHENAGGGLLQKFNGSVSEMVMALAEAPEGGWKPWEFSQVPMGFWDDKENQKKYMKWLGEKLGFRKPEDWYGLTHKLIHENGGGGLLQKFNGSVSEMILALEEAPEGGWVREKFGRSTQPEALMLESLAKWFRDFRTESASVSHGLKWHTGVSMKADVLLQELKFAIEYHNNQHFQAIESFGGQEALEMIQKRDQEKREAFKKAGYIYIEIPHFKWAGGSEAALKNLILEQLQEYEASSDAEVKARAARIREILSR